MIPNEQTFTAAEYLEAFVLQTATLPRKTSRILRVHLAICLEGAPVGRNTLLSGGFILSCRPCRDTGVDAGNYWAGHCRTVAFRQAIANLINGRDFALGDPAHKLVDLTGGRQNDGARAVPALHAARQPLHSREVLRVAELFLKTALFHRFGSELLSA